MDYFFKVIDPKSEYVPDMHFHVYFLSVLYMHISQINIFLLLKASHQVVHTLLYVTHMRSFSYH